MHYALDIRTFLFSHYFYTGVRIAIGVVGLTMLVYNVADMPTTMTVFLGALCTSLMDLPSPLRHKFNEMLAGVLLCTLVMLLISLCAPVPWLVGAMMVVVSFFASMMVVYGKKTMPLQFAALMVMTLSMENQVPISAALANCVLFLGGGLGYLAYSMVVSWFLRRRIKQQVLAEALFELARYLRIKADFYDVRHDLAAQFNQLVRQQIVVADKQQASRDLILRDLYTKQDGLLVQVHLSMLELYEQVLSTHADYAFLRDHFGDKDVMIFLRDLANKTAEDIESIAYAITRKKASSPTVNYKAELRAIQYEMQQMAQPGPNRASEEALTILRVTYNKIRDIIELIGQLHQATQNPVDPIPILPGSDMTPFLTQQKFKFNMLLVNLRWQSPIFRFAIRVALAVTTGLWISSHLPYMAHGYWIVLTIVIILKPNFSATKQRMADRLIGTIIGCLITALILRFVHNPMGLMAVLFAASVAAPAFTYVKYRYTAIAASVQILMLLNLLLPAGHQGVVSERLIDTVIGVVIATIFSYVLPAWEYRDLPKLLRNVLKASQRYLTASRDMLEGKVKDDFFYRVCRKGFMDSLAALISALVRMMDEPVTKHRAVKELNRFIVQNYLVAAHIAALRLMLRRHQENTPQGAVNQLIESTYLEASQQLAEAQRILAPKSKKRSGAVTVSPQAPQDKALSAKIELIGPVTPEPVPADASAWSGWNTLQRRTSLLNQDLREIVVQTAAIDHILRQQN
ncbi:MULTISPECIES: FUSC family membrane protein [unclassified Herbaspirillum]|uniref:FUSC family membrane protein n=1 Tax=unclassified Herbaspirillum TaxID=2624150 RepID=UPI0011540A82|nr:MULTISPECIES: FUSC family membrane protein [unclassified Herbaspirillum]TQK04370.1 putative membrane protein YccC [Herbaspirillum sp. SJZ130]TQK09845.1 putative membrane protein YccC [Herbaspirillum sp. SJZ106]